MNSFIKRLMDERDLKQKELATILGISPAAVSQWNEEGTNISTDCLFSLSKLFHVTVDELLEGKRMGESLEDKWKREYDINEEIARNAMMDHDKEALLQCLETVNKANDRFFILVEKIIKDKITDSEIKEFDFLKKFYEIKSQGHYMFSSVQINSDNTNIIAVIDNIKAKVGEEKYEDILWELKNKCKIMNFGIDQFILSDFEDDLFYGRDFNGNDIYYDEDIFYAWYNILTPIEKDEIINAEFNENKGKCQRIDYLCELIKRGGNILYTPSDLNLTNYDYEDLKDLEGAKPVSVPDLDNAQAVIYEIYDNYSLATYEQYQALINHPRMNQIEMKVKYKEKNPVKYWDYIKNNNVLI